jgi:LysR family glycine cleavage system transcriptional activator
MSIRENIPMLNALAVFAAAARSRSFTAASKELNIAQSAVSRHVSNLEQYFGISLFLRQGKRLELTSGGQRLADAVTIGLGHIRGVLNDLQTEALSPAITIACSFDMASLWLMPRFGLLRAELDGRDVRLVTAAVSARFDDKTVDLSIRFGQRADWPDLTTVLLFREEAFPVCSPAYLESHPELKDGDPKALLDIPLLYADQRGIRWRDWFTQAGLPTPALRGPVFSNYIAVLYEVLAARGVALAWKHMVGNLVEKGRLVRLGDLEVQSDNAFFAVYRGAPHSLQARLAEWLASSVGADLGEPLLVTLQEPDGSSV